MTETANISAETKLSGKYLTFALSGERYGFQILKVQEIIGVLPITRVPGTAGSVKGVINLRGKIIPIIDLRLKFSLAEAVYDEKTCIIVANVNMGSSLLLAGIIVDTVLEVLNFAQASIEPAPDYGSQLNTDSIIGLGRTADANVVILLDVNKIFSDSELKNFQGEENQASV